MKIKNITFILTLLGIATNLHAAKIYQLADGGSSFTAAQDPGGPPVYGEYRGTIQFGGLFFLTETQLNDATPAGTNVTGKEGLYVLVDAEFDESNMYIANSGTLKAVEDLGEYAGAPIVRDVHAEQIPGTKKVGIYFWMQLDETKADSSNPVFIEVWFRKQATDVQWQRCFDILSPARSLTEVSTVDAGTGLSVTTGHKMEYISTGEHAMHFAIEWDAGSEKPNYQAAAGQIRVRVIYSDYGYMATESQWDGYEVSMGKLFKTVTPEQSIDINDPDGGLDWEFSDAWMNSNSQKRVGTIYLDLDDGYGGTVTEKLPVFSLSDTDIQTLTGSVGTAGTYYIFSDSGTPDQYKLYFVQEDL
jgi:hypothetical protein